MSILAAITLALQTCLLGRALLQYFEALWHDRLMVTCADPACSVNYGLLPQTWEDPAHKAEEVSPQPLHALACSHTICRTARYRCYILLLTPLY